MSRKQRKYTYDEWKEAMDLHNGFKFGSAKISRILNIPVGTVEGWIYEGKIPPEARWKAESCIELAYVIGSLEDGCVSKTTDNRRHKIYYIIILAVIDPEFAITFSRAMSRLLGVNYHEPRWSEKEKKWVVRYDSKAFYTWYKRCEEQGLEGFKPYIEYNKETVRYYLKGLFDSEGYNYRCKQIFLCNSNIELLRYVQYLLNKYFDIVATGPNLQKKVGTKTTIKGIEYRYNHDYYYISINRKSHVRKFFKEIGFSIVRKQLGLRKHEKMLIDGRYVEPYKLVELGPFKLPF